jgi:hypothetical protein
MDQRNFIAGRIDVQLRRHLGMPVDTHRAVNDARYARDLLLVCDAMVGTELPHLAAQFRVAVELINANRRALAPRRVQRVAAEAPPPRETSAPAPRAFSFSRAR